MSRLFSGLIISIFCSFSWGQTPLYYSLKEGDKFVVQQDAQQRVTQEFEGYTHELENIIDGLMEFKVTDVQSNQYEIDMTFLDLGMQMKSNIQGEIMNIRASQLDEADTQSRIFNSLLHVPVQIVIDKSGNVLAVKGGNILVEKMTEASGLTDSISLQALKHSLEGEFGSEALSNSFEQMTYIYPEKDSLSPTSWENEYSGKLSAKNLWTLEQATDSLNHIKGMANITLDINDPGTAMHLSGQQETTLTTDSETGLILDMLVESFSSGTATTEYSGDTEIPTTVSSTTTYKIIRN